MADSPKCKKCVEIGLNGQTYKLWGGKHGFKCGDCKNIYQLNSEGLVSGA